MCGFEASKFSTWNINAPLPAVNAGARCDVSNRLFRSKSERVMGGARPRLACGVCGGTPGLRGLRFSPRASLALGFSGAAAARCAPLLRSGVPESARSLAEITGIFCASITGEGSQAPTVWIPAALLARLSQWLCWCCRLRQHSVEAKCRVSSAHFRAAVPPHL